MRTWMKTAFVAVLVFAVMPAVPAQPGDTPGNNKKMEKTRKMDAPQRDRRGTRDGFLLRADADKDGVITRDELKAAMPNVPDERFAAADTNADGQLTRDELRAAAGQGPDRLFARLDRDKNEVVTFGEWAAIDDRMTQERFDGIDRDGDGAISAAEFRRQSVRRMTAMAKADTNKDGKTTFDEIKAANAGMSREQFSRLDTNGDGVLSRADRRAAGTPREKREGGDRSGMKDSRLQYTLIDQLRAADRNGDDRITYDEVQVEKPGFPRVVFDRYDVNKDGAITDADR